MWGAAVRMREKSWGARRCGAHPNLTRKPSESQSALRPASRWYGTACYVTVRYLTRSPYGRGVFDRSSSPRAAGPRVVRERRQKSTGSGLIVFWRYLHGRLRASYVAGAAGEVYASAGAAGRAGGAGRERGFQRYVKRKLCTRIVKQRGEVFRHAHWISVNHYVHYARIPHKKYDLAFSG
ncbi:hypothetical protein [Oryza sativa Japonica Group]|uniref:Uncharacterized protein n=1 Tax=Oryza sativa subsp. japonica TaxID=39947 RepID=Q9FTL6_ORYSJ|nr:hypothetical protein [Oryza sativa Japonica Group]BAB40074.1 hypothetical protein [Oryza sativa Japonica Group]